MDLLRAGWAIAGTSLCKPAPKEPVHRVMPFAAEGTTPVTKRRSSKLDAIRGNPIRGRGRSSGWIAKRMPNSSAVGTTS